MAVVLAEMDRTPLVLNAAVTAEREAMENDSGRRELHSDKNQLLSFERQEH